MSTLAIASATLFAAQVALRLIVGASPMPSPAASLDAQADAQFAAGSFDAAYATYVQSSQANAEDYHAWLYRGITAVLRNDGADAKASLAHAIATNPTSSFTLEADAYIAEAYERGGDYASAAPYLRALGEIPEATVLGGLGSAYDLGETQLPVVVTASNALNVPIVMASINGGPVGQFILDTGATYVTLDTDYAAVVGVVATGSEGGLHTVLSPNNSVSLGRVDKLTIGSLTVRNIPTYVYPMKSLTGSSNIVGVIGAEFMSHFSTSIDFQNSTVTFDRVAGARASGSPVGKVPIWLGLGDQIFYDAVIDGYHRTVYLDTGQDVVFSSADSSQLDMTSLQTGPISVLNPSTRQIPNPKTVGLGLFTSPGSVGAPFFRGYVLTIDYKNHVLYLDHKG